MYRHLMGGLASVALAAGLIMSNSGAAQAAAGDDVIRHDSIQASASTGSARAACGGAPSDEDSSSWPRMPAGTSANERYGPSTQCGIKGWADNQDQLDYHCWAPGENGTWTYLRNNSDGSTGWVKDTLLPGGGAVYAAQCWA